MATSPTTVKLPDDLKARIAAQAEAGGLTLHAYLLQAIREKADPADRRHAFLAAGSAAWDEYQRTGIACAFEDVKEYVLALAAGKKPAPPKPEKRPRKKG